MNVLLSEPRRGREEREGQPREEEEKEEDGKEDTNVTIAKNTWQRKSMAMALLLLRQ